MEDSWLYEMLGRESVAGTRTSLAIFKDESGLREAFSERFISRLNSNTVVLTLKISPADLDLPVNANDMLFIDTTGSPVTDIPSFMVTRVASPKKLVEISSILGTVASSGSRSFILINSLNDLIEANGSEKTERFMDFILSRARYARMGCLVLAIGDRSAAPLIKAIAPLFDKVFRF
jgi:hypothetical protein